MIIESIYTSCRFTEVHKASSKEELWDSLVKMLDRLNESSSNDFKSVAVTRANGVVAITVKY